MGVVPPPPLSSATKTVEMMVAAAMAMPAARVLLGVLVRVGVPGVASVASESTGVSLRAGHDGDRRAGRQGMECACRQSFRLVKICEARRERATQTGQSSAPRRGSVASSVAKRASMSWSNVRCISIRSCNASSCVDDITPLAMSRIA